VIRAAALGLAALAGTATALAAQEGGPIRGGEHDGFTRVVMTVEPTTEWSLETLDGRATILFPGKRIAFGTAEAFDRIPRSRIADLRVEDGAAGTLVTLELACDCRVSTAFVGARFLAIDVADRAAPPAPPAPPGETPEERAAREALAVASAEQLLIRQIERAADQGLVEISGDAPVAPTARPASPAAEPPPEPTAAEEAGVAGNLGVALAALDQEEQIEATTVFDRDSRHAAADGAEAVPPVCLPDDRIDVGGWSNGLGFPAQLPALRRRLVGEFDIPDPRAIGDLARLYIRFGLGAEAASLLRGFALAPVDDRPLLDDLARVVEGLPPTPEGPLAAAVPCPGRHGLWLALGGGPAFRDAATFAAVQAEFQALPSDLRTLLAPRFVDRLIAAGRPAEARIILDTAVRTGGTSDPGLDLAAARLAVAEGRTLQAAEALGALVEAQGHAPVEALEALGRLGVEAGLPIPDRIVTDLRAAALQYRGSEREPALRALLAEALASRGELPAALREARAAAGDLPAEAEGFEALAVDLLAAADPAATGDAAYARSALAATDLILGTPPGDPRRARVATHLAALGLPDPARRLLAPGDNAVPASRAALGAAAAPAFVLAGDPPGPYAWPAGPAFEAPLPPLDTPSLAAARSLLAGGGRLEGFVADLLADRQETPEAFIRP
jgi:hypothetical protein